MRRFLHAVVLWYGITNLVGAQAPGVSSFAGKWHAVKPTGSITTVEIRQLDPLRWTAHAWGACTPRDCDWGEQPFRVLTPGDPSDHSGAIRGIAVWPLRDGSGNRFVVLRFDGNELLVEHYAVSGARNSLAYFSDTRMRRDTSK
jgi:hypothetical protein